jgi:hypothetical protein
MEFAYAGEGETNLPARRGLGLWTRFWERPGVTVMRAVEAGVAACATELRRPFRAAAAEPTLSEDILASLDAATRMEPVLPRRVNSRTFTSEAAALLGVAAVLVSATLACFIGV